LIQIKGAGDFSRNIIAMDVAFGSGELLAYCGSVLNARGGTLAGALAAGMLSGLTHCAGMCGPLVMAQAELRFARLPVAAMTWPRRLTGAAALPYQFGRITTYAVLGALAAGGLAPLLPASAAPGLAAAALLAVAALFSLHGIAGFAAPSSAWTGFVTRLAKPLLDRPFGWRGYAVGLALGLLPCGMIYAALLVAATTGHALAGAAAMALFGLGTLPGLVAIGWLGHAALARWQPLRKYLPSLLLLANAGALLAVAARLIG
jgi:sulfite exporter TauE/SafE